MKNTFWMYCLLGLSMLFAQKNNSEVLFTINEKPFDTETFMRVYRKNLDLVKDESQKDLNNYLQLYIAYKLKIQKAHKLGLHEDTRYLNELQSYRSQLSKNYLTDTQVTEALLKEAFDRMQWEIKCSHILVQFTNTPNGPDTLAAYKKIKDIQQKLAKGEDFEKLAVEFSEDPSAKENKGNLGYFSAFRMVYDFENGAFKTPVGKVSDIVKSRFGYHLIKVNDKRPHRGEITVAHIMIATNDGDDAETKKKQQTQIQEIYQKLQQGEDFAELAKQFSEDKSTAANGGLLQRFSSGELSSEIFEDKAFALSSAQPISAPFESQFGWHIVKLIEKHPAKKWEEAKKDLELRVQRDERSKLIAASLHQKLQRKYQPKLNDPTYRKVAAVVTDSVYKGSWKKPESNYPYLSELITIKDKKISGDQFMTFLERQQRMGDATKPLGKWLKNQYDTFLNQELQQYYEDNLESEFIDFAHVMEEYREGLLLFDLLEKEIWNRAKNDTIGLQNHFDKNRGKYQWKTRYDVVVLSSLKKEKVEEALKMMQQKKTIAEIKEAINKDNMVEVMITEGKFEKENGIFPKNYTFTPGYSAVIEQNNYFFVVYLKETLAGGPKTFEEAKGRVINDYQQYLEENWVSELQKEFTVKVNDKVFEKLKAKK